MSFVSHEKEFQTAGSLRVILKSFNDDGKGFLLTASDDWPNDGEVLEGE